jgi:hypothetical protein
MVGLSHKRGVLSIRFDIRFDCPTETFFGAGVLDQINSIHTNLRLRLPYTGDAGKKGNAEAIAPEPA